MQKLEKGIELAIEMQKKTMTEGIELNNIFKYNNL